MHKIWAIATRMKVENCQAIFSRQLQDWLQDLRSRQGARAEESSIGVDIAHVLAPDERDVAAELDTQRSINILRWSFSSPAISENTCAVSG
jgi:hypothetical protein